MKHYIGSHWFWFFVLLSSYTALDYADHITREGSVFQAHPLEWLLFSIASLCTLCVSFFYISVALNYVKVPPLLSDLIAFCLAFSVHVKVSGPLWSMMLWSYSSLDFRLTVTSLGLFLAFYIVYRIFFTMILALIDRYAQR